MRLLLLHPKVAIRDCDHCQKYSYNEETGTVNQWNGQDRLRVIPAEKPPCRTPLGCPKGTPEDSSALTLANWLCYRYDQRCRIIGYPNDTLVAEHGVIIREVEREVWEQKQLDALQSAMPVQPASPLSWTPVR